MKALACVTLCVVCLVIGVLVPSPLGPGEAETRLAPATDGAEALSFFAFGRQGHDERYDPRVSESLERYADLEPMHFGILLGDIVFPSGVRSIDDPVWGEKFEQRNGGRNLGGVPFYALLGNHDSYGNVDAMIEYAQRREGTGRFRMGGRYYSEDFGRVDGRVLARIVFIDSVSYLGEDSESNADEQIAFIREAFNQPGEPVWRIVAGHHAVASPTQSDLKPHVMIDSLRPVLVELGVDLYLCSDPWFQEVYQVQGEPLYVATNGPNDKTEEGMQITTTDDLFVSPQGGFAHVRLDSEEMIVGMINWAGEVDYTATRSREE